MRKLIFRIGVATILLAGRGAAVGEQSVDQQICMGCGPIEILTSPLDKANAVERLVDGLFEGIGAGKIESCDPVIKQRFGKGFSAVAGACEVRFGSRRTTWMICQDDGVGNFSASVGVRASGSSLEKLHNFIANCVGG